MYIQKNYSNVLYIFYSQGRKNIFKKTTIITYVHDDDGRKTLHSFYHLSSCSEFLPSRNAETTARATDSDAALRMSQV